MKSLRPVLVAVWIVGCGGSVDDTPTPEVDGSPSLGDAGPDGAAVSSDGSTPSDAAVSDAGPSTDGATNALHPNEPSGFTAFAQTPCDVLPPTTAGTPSGWLGVWSRSSSYPAQNLVVDDDVTAPRSPPKVLKTRFPSTMTGGTGPVYFSGWDAAGHGTPGRKLKVYWHAYYKIVDSGGGYENHPGPGTKQGWFAYGDNPATGNNQGFPMLLQSSQSPRIDTSFGMAFFTQGPPAGPNDPPPNRNINPNVGKFKRVTVGTWHSWEILLEINDPDKSNGVLKMWWDGSLSINVADVRFRNTLHPNSFFDYTWNPTYGGGPTTKTRDDYMLFDDIYISGVAGQ